ncbi:hypothetical protein QUW52_15320, partial [Phocaeicola barnesiae]|nr:hypothetical protein [Phocaeicola barnesiae]
GDRCFISACKGRPVPAGLCKAGPLRGLLKKSSSPGGSGIFSQSLAQSGTGQKGRQEIKYRLDKPQMSNSKNERYEQKQLHPDGKIP